MVNVFASDQLVAKTDIQSFGEACTWLKPAPDTNTSSGVPWILDAAEPTSYAGTYVLWIPAKSPRYRDMITDRNGADDTVHSYKDGLVAGLQLPFTPEFRDGLILSDGTTQLYLASFSKLAPNGPVILYYVTFEA